MRLPALIVASLAAGCARSAALAPAAPTPAAAAIAATRGTYVLLHGADTVAVERFTRSAERLQVELRITGAGQVGIDAVLGADATVARMEVTAPTAGGDGSLTFRGDSVVVAQRSGDSTVTLTRAAPRGTVPYINPSPSLMEQILRRAHVIGGASVTLPVFAATGANQTVSVTVTFRGDSARMDLAGTVLDFRVEPGGPILGGRVPAQGLTIVRTLER